MPMSFPEMKDLISAAEVHKFRQPDANESESDFRAALADHVSKIDFVESMEIRTGKGWDQFNERQNMEMLLRGMLR